VARLFLIAHAGVLRSGNPAPRERCGDDEYDDDENATFHF
jgi:hypothetical protein